MKPLKGMRVMEEIYKARRDKTMAKLIERKVPFAVVTMVQRIWTIDPGRQVDVRGGDGPTKLSCAAWYGSDAREDEIVRLLISLRFRPNGISALLTGDWEWTDAEDSEPDAASKTVLEFIAAALEENAIRSLRNRALANATAAAHAEAARTRAVPIQDFEEDG